ncbi:hypothetical protein OTU49_006269 [Cherax quadricarinatus]|uniref:Polyhomeotic n=3 Tax=Cherax quadricarinatus TaxID=27406 RepID=A0AAW0VV92_CHEQU
MENPTQKKLNPITPLTTENNSGKKVNPVTSMQSSGTTTHMTQAAIHQLPTPTINGAPSSESGEVHDRVPQATVNGTAHPVAPLPPTTGPPKAMVKPQVLTHVIEGFVIHEGKKAGEQTSTSPKGDTAKCEFCGKIDLRSKFKRSKRFCSTACAKRYNVGCSKRIGLFKNPEESPNKRAREDSGMEEADAAPQLMAVEPQAAETTEMEVDETVAEGDGTTTVESPSKSQTVNILKWTVKDVVDFIQNLPGCKEYAEDFALQEIDGQALMLLKADHLMSAMSMKLGPALKICAKIESMRGDRKET